MSEEEERERLREMNRIRSRRFRQQRGTKYMSDYRRQWAQTRRARQAEIAALARRLVALIDG